MSAQWIISVSGKTYGPYDAAQMQDFAVEGRLAAHSLIARSEGGKFGPAAQDAELTFLFLPAPVAGKDHPAEEPARTFGHADFAAGETVSHFLIIADMRSGSITTLEEEICRLGAAYGVMPQAWVLASEMTIGALKNLLVQKMGKLDTLFIVDASHDKLTWSNLGPEIETRVRRIWAKQTAPQQSAA